MKINYGHMQMYCNAPEDYFATLGQTEKTTHGNLTYIDHGSDILAIAHLDSHEKPDHFNVLTIGKGKTMEKWVYSPVLDDRLGVYIIMSLLPSIGITCDILLTTSEENSNSTGQFFKPKKEYKWMFQFDRGGEGVVHYQYGSKALKKGLGKAGFKKIEYGMASDISKMGHVGCEGFNVGCGYAEYHTLWARADMSIMANQVYLFSRFYDTHKGIYLPYPYEKSKSWVERVPNAQGKVWYDGKYVYPNQIPVCKDCGGDVEAMARYKNVCLKCEKDWDTCIFCQYGYSKTFIHDGVCSKCQEKIDKKDNFLTGVTCNGTCGKPITYHELIEGGTCYFCAKHTHHGSGYYFG